MSRQRLSDPLIEGRAGRAIATARTVQELRAAQSILLSATLGITLEQTAAMLGVSRASAARLQKRFRESSTEGPRADEPKAGWGGRRRALMSYQARAGFSCAVGRESCDRRHWGGIAAARRLGSET